MIKKELLKIKTAIVIPAFILILMWAIQGVNVLFELHLGQFGIYPRHESGLIGILFGPLIHGDWKHLTANSVPFLVLSSSIFYFYPKIRYRVFLGIWLFAGIFLWIGGRSSYHIGMSGVIYGMAAFIILSGILRKERASMVIAILVVFLYGGMAWGVFPWFTEANVSWEGHLYGAVSGFFLAYLYRAKDRQQKKVDWDRVEENLSDDDPYWDVPLPESETRKRKIKLKGETAIVLFLFLAFIVFLFLFRYGKDFL